MGDQLFISIPYGPVRRIPSPVGLCVRGVIHPPLAFKSSTGHPYEASSGFVCEPQFAALPLCFLHKGTLVIFSFSSDHASSWLTQALLCCDYSQKRCFVLFFPLFIQYYSPLPLHVIHRWVNVPKFPNKIRCFFFQSHWFILACMIIDFPHSTLRVIIQLANGRSYKIILEWINKKVIPICEAKPEATDSGRLSPLPPVFISKCPFPLWLQCLFHWKQWNGIEGNRWVNVCSFFPES